MKKGEIVKAQVLHLAVLIDHDVIGGAPAGIFVDGLVMRLEEAYGL